VNAGYRKGTSLGAERYREDMDKLIES